MNEYKKTGQQQIDYERIEKAIHFIKENFKEQPALEEIAQAVNLSPYHFQRLFSAWAGISPKKFMQYMTIGFAKELLQQSQTIFEAAIHTGLSGPGRLHDLFVKIECMTPGEFKNGGAGLSINYYFAITAFGKIIVASTPKGVCHMHFEKDEEAGLRKLQIRFPRASFYHAYDHFQQDALSIFQCDWQNQNPDKIRLHLAGSQFQIKVWETLLAIPMGALTTYGSIASHMDNPKSSRAVGTAVGKNPIAYLIPCHRVIQQSGHIGGYMWGLDRKYAMIGWEAAKTHPSND